MDLSTLREFVALAYNLNYSQTAKQLYISQSRLSKHIKSLEQELGVRLFVRDTRAVALTPAGRHLSDRLKQLIDDFDDAVDEAMRIEGTVAECLVVAHLNATSGFFLPYASREFHAMHENAHVTFRSMEVDDVLAAVRSGEANVGITALASGIVPDGLDYRVLSIDRFGILASKKHALTRQEKVTADDLKGTPVLIPSAKLLPLTSAATYAFLEKGGAKLDIRKEMNDIGSISPFLLSTNGVACTMEHAAVYFGDDFAFIPFADDGYRKPLHVIIWRHSSETPALIDFVDCVQRAYSR